MHFQALLSALHQVFKDILWIVQKPNHCQSLSTFQLYSSKFHSAYFEVTHPCCYLMMSHCCLKMLMNFYFLYSNHFLSFHFSFAFFILFYHLNSTFLIFLIVETSSLNSIFYLLLHFMNENHFIHFYPHFYIMIFSAFNYFPSMNHFRFLFFFFLDGIYLILFEYF